MKIIGLTGCIGTGKSTVARMLQKRGIPVICADSLAYEATAPGKPALAQITKSFGKELLNKSGALNRLALAKIVFSSPLARKKLNRIVHPFVIREMKREIAQLKKRGKKLLVLDIPLLYEEKLNRLCNMVIVVYTPEKAALNRLLKRKGIATGDARRRMNAQISIEKKKKWADIVIDNSGSLENTQRQVEDWLKLY